MKPILKICAGVAMIVGAIWLPFFVTHLYPEGAFNSPMAWWVTPARITQVGVAVAMFIGGILVVTEGMIDDL